MSSPEEFVVITGGPGAGKTTLLDRLRRAGFTCVPEAGRQITRDQAVIGGPARHGADSLLFAELMLSWEIRSHRQAGRATGIVFFDRGVPDVAGYFSLLGHPVPAHVSAAAETFRYHRTVFLAPPWAGVYTRDRERAQDFEEAVRTHDAVAEAYRRHGYRLVTLPKADVDARAAFVLQHLRGTLDNTCSSTPAEVR